MVVVDCRAPVLNFCISSNFCEFLFRFGSFNFIRLCFYGPEHLVTHRGELLFAVKSNKKRRAPGHLSAVTAPRMKFFLIDRDFVQFT